jgi:hypothetical protein
MKRILFAVLTALFLSPAAHAIADSNGNGMSDPWERLFNNYQLFPASILPADDADGDGVSNLNECNAGTDPFDGTPPLGFLQANVRHVPAVYTTPVGGGDPVLVSPEAFVISWPTQYGKQYTLNASPDLSPGSWLTVGEPEYGYGSEIEIATLPTYQDGTLADKFFWRVAVTDIDSDGDGFSDYDECLKGTDISVADRDDDGLPDSWEILYGLDPDNDGTDDLGQGRYGDLDADGLSNLSEYWYSTNPNVPDTDADNLTDGEEAYSTSTDPTKPDTNGNGIQDGQEDSDHDDLTNLAELRIHHTQPRNPDTDYDKLRDGWEVSNGLDPLLSNIVTDPDGDGLTNVQEQRLSLNPLEIDTNDDGTLDWAEDPDGDGLTNLDEFNTHHTDPLKADTDNDAISDASEINTYLTNPVKHDSDGDGMPDGWEIQHFLNAKNATGIDGASGDPEPDGLDNFHEWINGCDPHMADTDGDGTNDLTEVTQGSDPNDPTDGGDPPEDEIQEVDFKAYGDYASWRMEIRGDGPNDHRTMFVVTPAVGVPETGTMKLRRNNKYKVTLHHTGSKEDEEETWYCWEAQVDDKPGQQTFQSYEPDRIPGAAMFFTIGDGHWLVDNRDGLFTSHNHRTEERGGNVASGLEAFLVPVAIEDNIAATGVDIVSNSVAPQIPGYLDTLWVMAPIAGPPPPTDYSNSMKFNVPLNPSAELRIECQHAEADPATIALGSIKPSVLWRGTGANITSDNSPTFKIGPHGSVIDLPIRVKAMKHRKVKVQVHLVNLLRLNGGTRELDQDMLPTESELSTHLYEIFARQLNTWFEVTYDKNPDGTFKYAQVNPGIDGNYAFQFGENHLISDDQHEILNAVTSPSDADIRVFIIASGGQFVVQQQELALGFASQEFATCWVSGNSSGSYNRVDDLLSTTAHEIGHILVGYGHPDDGTGVAPLPGTDHPSRLMCSGLNRSVSNGRHLVKSEWDEAETWLTNNIDNDQP